MKFLEFFQSAGENSSKRLAGLSATSIFLLLALIGGVAFLIQGKPESFQGIIDSLALFAGACLGLGLFDKLSTAITSKDNKEKSKTNTIKSNNIDDNKS